MKNLTTGNDDSRATLVRDGILVAIACMVATVVWLGARTRADDSGGPDTTGGDNSSQTVEKTSVEQDRKSVGEGKRVSGRVDLGGRAIIKKKNKKRSRN